MTSKYVSCFYHTKSTKFAAPDRRLDSDGEEGRIDAILFCNVDHNVNTKVPHRPYRLVKNTLSNHRQSASFNVSFS